MPFPHEWKALSTWQVSDCAQFVTSIDWQRHQPENLGGSPSCDLGLEQRSDVMEAQSTSRMQEAYLWLTRHSKLCRVKNLPVAAILGLTEPSYARPRQQNLIDE